jgi:hypothetical protein
MFAGAYGEEIPEQTPPPPPPPPVWDAANGVWVTQQPEPIKPMTQAEIHKANGNYVPKMNGNGHTSFNPNNL